MDGSLSLATLSPDRIVDSPSASTMTMELSAAALATPHLTLAGQQSTALVAPGQHWPGATKGHKDASQLCKGPRMGCVATLRICTSPAPGPCQAEHKPAASAPTQPAMQQGACSSHVQPAADEPSPFGTSTLLSWRYLQGWYRVGGKHQQALLAKAGTAPVWSNFHKDQCPCPPGQVREQELHPHEEHGRCCAGSMPRSASSQPPGSLADEGMAGSREASQDLGSDAGFPQLKRLSISRGRARASMTGEPAPEVAPQCPASPCEASGSRVQG